MRKELKSNLEFQKIKNREFPNEKFKFYETFELNDYIYLFFYYHKLIYPLTHDLFWTTLNRGPVLINRISREYIVLKDLKDIENHMKKINSQFKGKLIRRDVDGFYESMSYELLIDLIKERRYLNLDDLNHIIKFNGLDDEKIRYNSYDMDMNKPHTTSDSIALYLYDDFSTECYKNFLDEIKVGYSLIKVDDLPVLLIPNKNVLDL